MTDETMNSARRVTRQDLFAGPLPFLGLGFGAGLAPRAPGTFGTLVAVPLVWLLDRAGSEIYLAITLAALVGGIGICGATARQLGVHDHGAIVWDEIAGLLVTLLFVPVTMLSLFLGFVLFRLFDILKPWPIRQVDRKVAGGLGIMLDDVLAGLFAGLVLFLLAQWGPLGLCARIP